MGNPFSFLYPKPPPPPPPPPLPLCEGFLQIAVNQYSSLSKSSKLLVIVCIGYIIWEVFTGKCKRCSHKEEFLETVQDALSLDLDMINWNTRTCISLLEHIRNINVCLPIFSSEENLFRSNMDMLSDLKENINWSRISARGYLRNMEILRNPEQFSGFSFHEMHLNAASVFHEVICNSLRSNALEKKFWDNITSVQKELLDQLIEKMKNAHPETSLSKLRFTVVYVFNKYKKGIFPPGMKLIEKAVERELRIEPVEERDVCTICLQVITQNRYTTECNHIFHNSCISSWLERRRNCPVCRTEWV